MRVLKLIRSTADDVFPKAMHLQPTTLVASSLLHLVKRHPPTGILFI